MPPNLSVEDLLLEWETALGNGTPRSVESLCPDSPEIQKELRHRIDLLVRLGPALDLRDVEDADLTSTRPVGHYQLVKVLGRGGMGVVYTARDLKLPRTVAVKVLRPDIAARPSLLKRFEREACVLATLRHDHIVPIHAAELEGRRPYFVMQWVEGGSLAARRHEFVGRADRAVALMEKVCRGVHHAHSHGVLHRDLKPANILLESDDRPLVSDFGLAKLLDAEDDPVSESSRSSPPGASLTGPGVAPGTPIYMAPEQFAGPPDSASPRTDVWSLGVILYELLTGRRPVEGTRPEDVADAVRFDEPPRPRALVPMLDRRLEAIVLKCLEKDPARRYDSALALADDLKHWRLGERCVAYPEGWFPPTARWVRRHAAAVAVAALLMVVAAAAVVVLRESPEVRAEAEYQKSLRERLKTLREGHPVALLEPWSQEFPHRWRAGHGKVMFPPPEAGEGVTINAREPSLLEVCPDPGLPAYRVRVEMRHDRIWHPHGFVGLYVAHTTVELPHAPQHFFILSSFDDRGVNATSFRDALNQPAGKFLLRLGHIGASPRLPFRRAFATSTGIVAACEHDPDKGDAPWRELVIDVAPDKFTLRWRGQSASMKPSDQIDLFLAQGANGSPDFGEIHIDQPLRGPLGLYVEESKISVRRLTVEPPGPG